MCFLLVGSAPWKPATHKKTEDPRSLNWLHVYFLMSQFVTKKWFDSSFQGYIHISTKGSATEGDLSARCCSAFELKHISSPSHWRHTGTQTPGNYSALWFPCREILLSTPKDRERNPELGPGQSRRSKPNSLSDQSLWMPSSSREG